METQRRGPFVGRERELGALLTGLAAAASGQGRVVLLAGEPGIGKTSTAEEFARRTRAEGIEVLVGRCYEGDGAPAFWPWLQVLRAYAEAREPQTLAAELGIAAPDVAAVYPELRTRLPGLASAPVLDPEHARFRFFDGVTRALLHAAVTRPVVLLFDDLHGADKPSLLLLQFLARALRESHLLVVGGLRDFALAREHPLAETLADLVREQVIDLVPLGGLTEEEVGELLAEVAGETLPPGLASAVHARTEGNPLYTMEVARMLASSGGLGAVAAGGRLDVPDTVRLAIGQRLRVLSPACQDLLALAALFGREFRAGALTRASGVDTKRLLELLDEAAAARIVDALPNEFGHWRFAHALFGETLADSLGAAARASMHAKAAAALASDPRAAEYASEIAHHWFEAGPAGDPEEAVTWLCRAAEHALGLLAHEEATRLYRKAVTALDWSAAPDDARRAEVLLGLGEACKRAGETSEAKQTFLDASALARKLASPELLTRAALGFAPAMTLAEQPAPDPTEVQLLEEAIAAWGQRESGLHARALSRLALVFLFGEPGRTESLDDRAIGMARRIGDKGTLRYVLAQSQFRNSQRTDPRLRLATATELVQLAEEANDIESLAAGQLWRCVRLLECGDAAAMRREQPALARAAAQLRQPVRSWYAHLLDANVAILDGRLGDAERAIHEALRVGEAVLPFAARAYFISFMLFLRTLQGRAGEFASEYRRMFEAHPSPASLAPLAWIESERGNAAEARRIVDRVTADDFVHVRMDSIALVSAAFLVDACALLDDTRCAAWLYQFMAPNAWQWVAWAEAASLGPVAHYLGVLARTLGRLDDAATHFEDALAQAARAASPTFLARTHYEYALLLRDRGEASDSERAVDLLAEARATADSIGMAGLRAKIDALDGSRALEADRSAPQIFHRDGDLWTIAYAGKEIRLRDMRGLHYLAMLLREPGREFHATDLVRGGVGPSFVPPIDATLEVARGLGDAGERLDARARAAYRTRLAVLDEAIAEAERAHDLERLEHASPERDAVVAELSAAARGKRASSDAERARVTATKGVKAALDRIAASHPELGAHLHATVHRGYFCSYVPDPRHPIEWDG